MVLGFYQQQHLSLSLSHLTFANYTTRPGPARPTEVFSFFLVCVPMMTRSWIPSGGGGEGVGNAAMTQSRKKVVAEARGGAGSTRRQRGRCCLARRQINEGGGDGGKVRVLSYRRR
jgi:hypothetical protein